MKISVFITAMLVAQVSASFFDVFQGAVLSVQNSFGKLLSDVVTDVKETVDCTILAVEHVLSLSNDATARYYEKCGSGTNKTDSASDARQDGLPKVEVKVEISNNEQYLQKEIPTEIDAQINKTLSKTLSNYNQHENLLSIESAPAQESKKIADIGDLVEHEMERLTNEVDSVKKLNLTASESSIDDILKEIKILENRQQVTQKTSETNKVHEVIDEVLVKLDGIEAKEATENNTLEDILKDLENNSNNSVVGLRQQFEERKGEKSRYINEIKNQIEDHDKTSELSGYIYDRYKSNSTQSVQNSANITLADKENSINAHPLISQRLSSKGSQDEEMFNSTTSSEIVDNYEASSSNETTSTQLLMLTDNTLNDTVLTRPSLSITENIFVTKSNLFETYTTAESNTPSTLSMSMQNLNADFNDAFTVTSYVNEFRKPVTETIPPSIGSVMSETSTLSTINSTEFKLLESSTTIGTNTAHNTFLNDTDIISTTDGSGAFTSQNFLSSDNSNNTSTTIPNVEYSPLSRNGVFSTPGNEVVTTPIYNDNDTMIRSTSTPIIPDITVIMLPVETTTASGNEDPKAMTTIESGTTSNIHIVNDSKDTTIMTSIHEEFTTKTTIEMAATSVIDINNYHIKVPSQSTSITLNTSEGEIEPAATTTTSRMSEPFTGTSTVDNLTTNMETGSTFTVAKNTFTTVSSTPISRDSRKNLVSEAHIEKTATEDKIGFDAKSKEIDPPTTNIIEKMDIPGSPLNPLNYKNSLYLPVNPITTTLPFNGPPIKSSRPSSGLTTYRPQSTFPHENNYKNAPLGLGSPFDSFFHIPQKNTEAHDRAVKEARQLIADSKRAEEIINNIFNHKNKFGAKSIFNNT